MSDADFDADLDKELRIEPYRNMSDEELRQLSTSVLYDIAYCRVGEWPSPFEQRARRILRER